MIIIFNSAKRASKLQNETHESATFCTHSSSFRATSQTSLENTDWWAAKPSTSGLRTQIRTVERLTPAVSLGRPNFVDDKLEQIKGTLRLKDPLGPAAETMGKKNN